MNILITGGAGFIGTNLTKAILLQGSDTVISIDNLNDYYSPEIKKKNIQQFQSNKNYIFHEMDIENKEDLERLFHKYNFDVVIHLAARAGVRPSIENPQIYCNTNVTGTVNLLECLKQHRINNFVFASSSSVYGESDHVPFTENMIVDFPASPYAATKRAGELICYLYSKQYAIQMKILRFFTAYGPYNRPDMAAYKFTKAIVKGEEIEMYGDGSTARDYTFIDDIVDGIMKSVELKCEYEVINLGSHNPVMLKDFIACIEKVVGKKAKINQRPRVIGDVTQTFADISQAKKILNWEPSTLLEEGLEKLYQWYIMEK